MDPATRLDFFTSFSFQCPSYSSVHGPQHIPAPGLARHRHGGEPPGPTRCAIACSPPGVPPSRSADMERSQSSPATSQRKPIPSSTWSDLDVSSRSCSSSLRHGTLEFVHCVNRTGSSRWIGSASIIGLRGSLRFRWRLGQFLLRRSRHLMLLSSLRACLALFSEFPHPIFS